jgi:hypothetical protein
MMIPARRSHCGGLRCPQTNHAARDDLEFAGNPFSAVAHYQKVVVLWWYERVWSFVCGPPTSPTCLIVTGLFSVCACDTGGDEGGNARGKR